MPPEQQNGITGKILIVGGYGQVGRLIAEKLAPLFPNRLIISGRNIDKAESAASEVGYGAQGRSVDIFAEGAENVLEGVSLVVVCHDQVNTKFVEQCLSRGIHYVDISADYTFLSQVEMLDGLARQNNATAILSVGLAPGLTNLLASHANDLMGNVDQIDILLEFGLGDHHGQAALEWMFDNLDASYEVMDNGRTKSVRSFSDSTNISLPGSKSKHPAYRFNFSDQHVIARTLNVPTVSTWVRFEDRLSTWLFATFSRVGLGRLLRRPLWRKIAIWFFMNIHKGSDICGVAIHAFGQAANGLNEATIGVIGRNESLMTAIMAAEVIRQMLTTNLEPGVFHSEQFVDFDQVIEALKAEYPDLLVTV